MGGGGGGEGWRRGERARIPPMSPRFDSGGLSLWLALFDPGNCGVFHLSLSPSFSATLF